MFSRDFNASFMHTFHLSMLMEVVFTRKQHEPVIKLKNMCCIRGNVFKGPLMKYRNSFGKLHKPERSELRYANLLMIRE